MRPSDRRDRKAWRQALWAGMVAVTLLLINDLFLFESVVIPSSSMRPSILPNERIFLRRFATDPIRRFDVVVIDSRKLGRRIAKRIVALPGERIRISDSWKVFVQGKCLKYSEERSDHLRSEAGDHLVRISGAPGPGLREPRWGKEELRLGPDEYFVLGDNRLASDDSRMIGPVRRGEIQGKLGLLWYSYDIGRHRLRRERILRLVR